jgi:large subunit ribosomal protein L37e
MTKGTSAHGKKSRGKSHIICRRCGNHSYNASKKLCASCGFGRSRKLRSYAWQNKGGLHKK